MRKFLGRIVLTEHEMQHIVNDTAARHYDQGHVSAIKDIHTFLADSRDKAMEILKTDFQDLGSLIDSSWRRGWDTGQEWITHALGQLEEFVKARESK